MKKDPLHVWYNEHTEETGQLIQEEAYKSTDILLPPPPATNIIPIKDVLTSLETNAPLDDEVAKRINKKSIICFLKYFERSFKSRAEKTYPVVKLYTEEQLNHETSQSSSSLERTIIVQSINKTGD